MLISGNGLLDLIKDGVITARPENVNASTIDLTMGSLIEVESPDAGSDPIDLMLKGSISTVQVALPYNLLPGQFCLAHTEEYFKLPDHISCDVLLKSSHARSGLNHALAGWGDAGWHGQLTLEFSNWSQYHLLRLSPGMKCAQVRFFEHAKVPEHLSYSTMGSYNGSVGVTKPSINVRVSGIPYEVSLDSISSM